METSIEKYDRKDIPAGGVPGAEKNGVPAVGKQDFVKKEDESREAFATRVRDTLQERFTIMLQEVFLNQLDKDLDKESKEEHEEFVPYDGFAGGLIIHMHSVIEAYMRMHKVVLAHQYQMVVGQLERISSEVLFEEGAVEVDVLSKMDEWTLVKFTRVQLKWWLLAHARCIALESMLHQSESLSQSTKEEVDRAIMQRVKNMEMLPVCDQDDLLGCQSPFALKVVDLVASMTLTRAGQQAQAGDTLGKGTLRAEIHKARKLTNKSTVEDIHKLLQQLQLRADSQTIEGMHDCVAGHDGVKEIFSSCESVITKEIEALRNDGKEPPSEEVAAKQLLKLFVPKAKKVYPLVENARAYIEAFKNTPPQRRGETLRGFYTRLTAAHTQATLAIDKSISEEEKSMITSVAYLWEKLEKGMGETEKKDLEELKERWRKEGKIWQAPNASEDKLVEFVNNFSKHEVVEKVKSSIEAADSTSYRRSSSTQPSSRERWRASAMETESAFGQEQQQRREEPLRRAESSPRTPYETFCRKYGECSFDRRMPWPPPGHCVYIFAGGSCPRADCRFNHNIQPWRPEQSARPAAPRRFAVGSGRSGGPSGGQDGSTARRAQSMRADRTTDGGRRRER